MGEKETKATNYIPRIGTILKSKPMSEGMNIGK